MSTIHMPLTAQVKQRFAELEGQVRAIRIRPVGNDTPHADPETFYAWASSAHNAIRGVFGPESAHCVNFEKELKSIQNNFVWDRKLESVRGIFLGAKSDVDGGHVFELEKSVTGELFADFVAAAKVALAEGHHEVASVLACAALEDSLKRFARFHGLQVDEQTMEEVVNALKSKGLVTGAQKALLSAMPKIRNYAMHAHWQKLTPQDAGSVIGYVEQFLLSHF